MTAGAKVLRLGVLVSGEGTTLQALIDRIGDGRIADAKIAVVISSRAEAGAIRRAERAKIPVVVMRVRAYPNTAAFSAAIAAALEQFRVGLAVQAGWLCFWKLPPRWLGRVINTHPSLLPEFGGKGMYGRHVHEAVLKAGRRESGATVHWVDNEYDKGEVIVQERCPVLPGDTAEMLAERVQGVERELLVRGIETARSRLVGGN